jgi:hypothetical protein
MVSTSELGRRFREGDTRGQSSNTMIMSKGNKTYLVDYGWAILASRDRNTGKITYYSGWDRYSPTTSKHISQLGLREVKNVVKQTKRLDEVM